MPQKNDKFQLSAWSTDRKTIRPPQSDNSKFAKFKQFFADFEGAIHSCIAQHSSLPIFAVSVYVTSLPLYVLLVLEVSLRVSLQSPGIPFFQCIKLYQVTCYSLSKILLAIEFEYIKWISPNKKTSQRLWQVPKCPKQQQYPTERKMTSNSTTCQLVQVWDQHFIGIMCSPKFEGKLTRTATRTARSRGLFVCFVFSREEWKRCPCVVFLQWIFNVFWFVSWNSDSEI